MEIYDSHAPSNNTGNAGGLSSTLLGLCNNLKMPVPMGADMPIIMFSETPVILSAWP